MPTPPELYYYTDAVGLQGILNPQHWPPLHVKRPDQAAKARYADDSAYTFGRAAHLMASDVRYMNDGEELSYGAKYIADAFTAAKDDQSIDRPLGIAFARIATLLVETAPSEWPFQWCAACFCEDGDLLSQWRGYAGGLGGFAIGFSGEALEKYSYKHVLAARGMVHDIPAPVRLHQVQYGPTQAAERAAELVARLHEAWQSGTALPADLDGVPEAFVGLYACEAAATLKHPAFAAEREWRLLTAVQKGYRSQVRARAVGLLPYVDMVVNARWSANGVDDLADLAVSTVRVGPARDQIAQVDAVKLLLGNRDHDWQQVEVAASDTPFLG